MNGEMSSLLGEFLSGIENGMGCGLICSIIRLFLGIDLLKEPDLNMK
jgi:hypothetical protein